ncbi:MAG: hypothetical protein H6808_04260 [Phycisphaera sp.]|nr:hypothetical protein [Phycisphaera sp.]
MTHIRTAAIALLAAAATTASADDQIFVGGPAGAVYVADSDTGEFTYFACFCIGPIVSIQPLGSDLLVADSFGGLWQLDGVTGVFETGAWTGVQIVDMAIDGEDAIVVKADGSVMRTPLAVGFPQDTIDAPAGVTSVLLFDGDMYVGTNTGEIHRKAQGESTWSLFGTMPSAIRTLAARPEALVVADNLDDARRILWAGGPDDGYYVTQEVVDAGYTGDFTLFTRSMGEVSVYDAETSTLVDTWTLPVEASAIFVRPGNVCKADTNRNGVLEAGDFSAWVAAYNRGDFIADQNNDLAVTPADFSAWVAAYNRGCD